MESGGRGKSAVEAESESEAGATEVRGWKLLLLVVSRELLSRFAVQRAVSW